MVSMSAIHHLEPAEKQALYRRCFEALTPGGIFINGDEYRPESDADYLAAMEKWCEHKDAETTAGRIPESFQPTFDVWYEKNIRNFGQPKKSGDDCHETLAAQAEYFREAGFERVETPWHVQMWGLLIGRK